MKEVIKIMGWPLLFIALWFNGCSDKNKTVSKDDIVIPKIEGEFKPKKPQHEEIKNTPVLGETKPIFVKGETVYKENPINPELIAENNRLKANFAKETDSLKKVIAYNSAIQLNKFSSNFEDDNLVLNVNGIVQGEVKEITPNYTIKQKELPKPKETVFRLLGGLELGNNTQFNGFAAKANVKFQNKKGNIISGSVDTNQTIWLGYDWSIFTVKK